MLEVKGLAVAYGRIGAVANVDLDVATGEIVTLVGANGAGKSSILKAIAGLERPTAGSIRLLGKEIAGWPAHRALAEGIAYVPEGRMIFGTLTVRPSIVQYTRRDDGTEAGCGWHGYITDGEVHV